MERNTWGMWDIMQRPKLHLIGIDGGEEFHVSGIDQIDPLQEYRKLPHTTERHTHADTRSIQNTK